jgi:Uma2 family endonuclease
MSIVLDERPGRVGHGSETSYPASAVVLAVEVVSPESQVRDRERKPQVYARAGIRHFGRVAQSDGRPAVCVYELDPATSPAPDRHLS